MAVEITNGKKTITVPDETGQAVLNEEWMKKEGWKLVGKPTSIPEEVIQFQKKKTKEDRTDTTDKPKIIEDLSSLSVRKIEERIESLTSEQLLNLTKDLRKTVKALAEKQLQKLSGK